MIGILFLIVSLLIAALLLCLLPVADSEVDE
jgi:hypothetical protein